MIFKAPWMLLLFAVLPILGGALARAGRMQEQAAEKLRGKRSPAPEERRKKTFIVLGAFASLILALSRPCWNPRETAVSLESRDLIFLLDVSRSMLAGDVFPSRLESAKIALFESLPALQGRRIGLITFAGAATVRVPLTLDHHFVRYMLERAAPSDAEVGGTSLQAAVEKAIDTVLSGADRERKDLIVFTDGEDHISHIEKTVELLSGIGTRVLIIGLGDPVDGARIPDPSGANTWMQYKDRDVITRLDEETLRRLAETGPNIVYHSSGTRPPDLLPLYRQMIADTASLPFSAGTETVHTEGYPFFLVLALILRFVPFQRLNRSRAVRAGVAAILLGVPGCLPKKENPEAVLFAEVFRRGESLWQEAQPLIQTDLRMALPILHAGREEFLRAAMLRPGNVPSAEQIAGISRQIRDIETAIREQEALEKEQQKQIEEALALLQELVRRENELARRSQQLLTRRPPSPADERILAAAESLAEQGPVHQGTQEVLEILRPFQEMLQKMLKLLYGEDGRIPPTEFDPAIELLQAAISSQETAIENLSPEQLNWPQANPALRTAASKMQQALESLSGQKQNQPSPDDSSTSEDDGEEWDYDDEGEWDESSQNGDFSIPMSSQNFKTGLENRFMPIPNYTAEEILIEETANQEQRAQQKAGRAAQVEKNW